MDYRFKRQVKILPDALGLTAVTLASERTSSNFSLKGYSEISVWVNLTYGAATRVDVNLDMSPDEGSSISAYKTQSATLSAGAATLDELDAQKTTGAANQLFELRFKDLNAFTGRLRISGSSGGATDIATVTVIAAHS